jgi:hypothetical protein
LPKDAYPPGGGLRFIHIMDMGTTVNLFSVGGACLGLWLVGRYPGRAPKSLTVSLVAIVLAFAILSAAAQVVGAVTASVGPAATLMLVVLPAFTLVFWACACFVRACVDMMALRH